MASTATHDEAALQHQRRVAAFAMEIGRSLKLSEPELNLLQEAAEHHDLPVRLFAPEVQSRLLRDVLGRELSAPSAAATFVPQRVRAVIAGFQGLSRTQEDSHLMDILWIADALDEHLEAEPYFSEPETNDEMPLHVIAIDHLRKASAEELRRIVPTLPVFPVAALRAVTQLVRPDVDNSDLERIARTDPVLAGRLISAANSALFSPRQEIRSLPQAISYMGPSLAKQYMLAAAVRPTFSSPQLRSTWSHSLECAELAGVIAARTRVVHPSEAVLAGLMHDVGVLALSMLNREVMACCARLTRVGCPPRPAEAVVYGFDHAEAGAEVLKAWKFPADLIEGVRHHHAPERDKQAIASVLYLAEFCTCSDEDLPSAARLRTAAKRIGMTIDQIVELKNPGSLTAAFAA